MAFGEMRMDSSSGKFNVSRCATLTQAHRRLQIPGSRPTLRTAHCLVSGQRDRGQCATYSQWEPFACGMSNVDWVAGAGRC